MLRATALFLAAAACNGARAPVSTPDDSPPIGRQVVFEGMCDASGAVEIDAHRFVVADDEDNVLRVYDADRGGPPLAGVDISADVGLVPQGKKQRMPELDLEAGTRIGDRAYWLTSHGRNSSAKLKHERLRFFATTVPADGASIDVVGQPYEHLVDQLLADPRFAAFDLAAAAARAPKDEGGLNLEGMTATPEGTLLLGFRNPVPGGRALLFHLLGPAELVEGKAPRFGDPFQLGLDGLGVRALTWWRDRYVIVAGPYASGSGSRLFTWDGRGEPVPVPIDLGSYNPEGTFTPEARDEVLFLSDDGERIVDGQPCKKLKDPSRRRFRGVWLRPTPGG